MRPISILVQSVAQRRDFIPPLSIGFFAGRLGSELCAQIWPGSWGAAIAITLITLTAAFWFRRRLTWARGWAFAILLPYFFLPAPQPATAVLLFSLSLIFLARNLQWPPPLSNQQKAWGGGGLVFVGTAVLYLATLQPDILPADQGEFQLIGAQLGVAHPPGFPLYTLLAHGFSRLSPFLFATPAAAINALSAIIAAATLTLLFLTTLALTNDHLASLLPVFALSSATTFWAQATTANIRSLTAFFAALAIFALVRFWQENRRDQPAHGKKERFLTLFVLALSLGFTHHLSLAFMGLVFVLFLLWIDPGLLRAPRRWTRPFLAALLGLLPLLYLPLRANAAVRGARPGLATWDGFLTHFLGLGFQGDFFYFIQPIVLWERMQVMGNVLLFQFSPWLLVGMGWGIVQLWRRARPLALLLGGAFALHTFITATYRAPQTVEYMLPAYLPAVIGLGVAAGAWFRPEKISPTGKILRGLITAGLLWAAAGQFAAQLPNAITLHHNVDTRDYAQSLLEEAPPDSLVLANWHWVTPLWYLQEVAGVRSDLTIRYVAPGADPYAVTWAAEINAALAAGQDVVATWFDEAAYRELPHPEPLGEAFLFRQTSRTELPETMQPFAQTVAGVQLHGYAASTTTLSLADELVITTAWNTAETSPVSLYVHLLTPDGRSIAQSDQQITPAPSGLTLTRFTLQPRPGTPPGEYILILGANGEHANAQMITVTAAAAPPVTQNKVGWTAVGEADPRTLVGYDWDFTIPGPPRLYLHWQTAAGHQSEVRDLQDGTVGPLPRFIGPWGMPRNLRISLPEQPQFYVPLGDGIVWLGQELISLPTGPGSQLPLDQDLAAAQPVFRDYVLSVRLVGYEADLFTWAWCDLVDGVPALGGIPTLKWVGGSRVRAPHTVIYPPLEQPAQFTGYCASEKPAPGAPLLYVAPEAVPGQTMAATLRVYDAFTGRPLPILDERIIAQYSWIPLGETFISD